MLKKAEFFLVMMNFRGFEKRAEGEEIGPRLERAMAIVERKISEIEELQRRGYGPHRVKEAVFGDSITYTMLIRAYQRITGKRLICGGYSEMDLGMYKGSEDVPKSVVDAVIARIGGGDDIERVYHYGKGNCPKAIRKF